MSNQPLYCAGLTKTLFHNLQNSHIKVTSVRNYTNPVWRLCVILVYIPDIAYTGSTSCYNIYVGFPLNRQIETCSKPLRFPAKSHKIKADLPVTYLENSFMLLFYANGRYYKLTKHSVTLCTTIPGFSQLNHQLLPPSPKAWKKEKVCSSWSMNEKCIWGVIRSYTIPASKPNSKGRPKAMLCGLFKDTLGFEVKQLEKILFICTSSTFNFQKWYFAAYKCQYPSLLHQVISLLRIGHN